MRIDIDTCRDPDLLVAEVRRLRAVIAALADQDATLSVCDGAVTVTMDATLTDAERAALDILADYRQWRSMQEDRIGTHSDDCHLWPRHERCMIHRLAAEVARLRQVLVRENNRTETGME